MLKTTIGKIKISSGMRKKSKTIYPTCKICGEKIKEGDFTVTIHKVGEMQTELHNVCAIKLSEIINKAAIL
jgi:hypothetical protein